MNTLIESCNALGLAMIEWMISMNIWCGLLLVVALIADRIFRGRVEPRLRLLLFAAVFVRLALPLEWASPLAINVSALGSEPSSNEAIWWLHDPVSDAAPASAVLPAIASRESADTAAVATSTQRMTWHGIAGLTWLATCAVMLIAWTVVRIRLAQLMRTAQPLDDADAPGGPLFVHPTLGPAVVGLVRPRIVMPADLTQQWRSGTMAPQKFNWIVRHERAHIARRDHIVVAAMQLVCILAWPVIAVWLAAARIRSLMEQACDERAIGGQTGSREDRRAYGELLLDMAGRARRTPLGAISTVGMLGQAHAAIRARLRQLARPATRRSLLLPVVLIAMIPVSLATAVQAPRTPAADRQAADHGGIEASMFRIEMRVFEAWPTHPKLKFDLAQTSGEEKLIRTVPADHRMTAEEFDAWRLRGEQEKQLKTIASPGALVSSGQQASIRSGTNDDDGEPVDGYDVSVTASSLEGGLVSLTFTYNEYGLEVRPPASEYAGGDRIGIRNLKTIMPAGSTQFAVATGLIGAPIRLVAVSVYPVDVNVNDAPDQLPQVEFYAVMWELGDTEPRLEDVLPEELRIADDQRRTGARRSTALSWLLPNGDADGALSQWLRENARGTSIGGKAGATVTRPAIWKSLDGPAGSYNISDVPPYRLGFLGVFDPQQSEVVDTVIRLQNIDPATGEPAGRVHWQQNVQFPPGALAVAVIRPSPGTPWRLLMVRARRINSWDDIPKQVFDVNPEILIGVDDGLPIPLPQIDGKQQRDDGI